MNRRDFLQRLAACGLVAAAPKLIFDLGANRYRLSDAELDESSMLCVFKDGTAYSYESTKYPLPADCGYWYINSQSYGWSPKC